MEMDPRLTSEDERVYRDIAEGRPVDAPASVARLAELGLVRDLGGRWAALDPKTAARRLLTAHHGTLARTLQQMAQVAGLESLSKHYDPSRLYGGPASEFVDSKKLMNARIADALEDADEGLLTVQPGVPSERDPAVLRESIHRARALLTRGLSVRSLYPAAALTHEPTTEYVDAILAGGGEVRVGRDLPPRLVLAGRELFVDNYVNTAEADAGWHIKDVATTAFARAVFDGYWHRSTPWQEARAALTDAVTTPTQRMILRGLSEGDTQAAVAKAVGISEREVRRDLAALRAELGLRSRDQLMVWWATSRDRTVP
ncbi:hypothetical protein [Streptomyces sp. S1]|uniref:helix-turn-helix transcriptional regulator n=1 Tax=Streptomyces sp. S1 TaxID=718288 RepID=UPI003D7254E9